MSMIANVTREQVYQALFAVGASAKWDVDPMDPLVFSTWVTTSRRLKLFNEVQQDQQPYFCQAEHAETLAQKSNLPYRRVFDAKWIVYQASAFDLETPGVILNNKIIDALQSALSPAVSDPGYPQRNTLGGLAYHTFIDGEILKDPGDIDNQAMLVIPVKVLVP